MIFEISFVHCQKKVIWTVDLKILEYILNNIQGVW